jgi:hypothetical protein
VADVAWVKMLLPEDASLQVGLCMTVQLEAGDKDGHVFKSSQVIQASNCNVCYQLFILLPFF